MQFEISYLMQIKISLRFRPSPFEWAPESKIFICGLVQYVLSCIIVFIRAFQSHL